MSFDSPQYLWLLLVTVPIVFLFLNSVRLFAKFQNELSKEFFRYSKFPSWTRRVLSHTIYIVVLTCLILGLAEPSVMFSVKDKEYVDVRLIFVLDVSRSMVYAEDVLPNRMVAMKTQVKDFYSKLDGIYECSILPFAGEANPYFCPLTKSKISFLAMLNELDWQSAPTLGTDLTKAMESVQDIYIDQDHVDKSGYNIVILISDGGKEESIATDRIKLLKICRDLSAKNFKIYTVGVGGEKPAPLIIRDDKGHFLGYVPDDNGVVSTSQLDEEVLTKIAEIGRGKYYGLNASSNLSSDLKQLVQENKVLITEKERFEKFSLQGYLFSIAVCLLVSCLLLNKV